jgi:hypothetical protein
MYAAGAEKSADVWAVHFYGTSYENLIRPRGAVSFLRKIQKPIWITESGAKGTLKQREYVERTWPLLRQLLPNIRRFFYYQFTESTGADETYGLRNLTPGRTVSDLYIYLRDRAR